MVLVFSIGSLTSTFEHEKRKLETFCRYFNQKYNEHQGGSGTRQKEAFKFSTISQHISCNYFYETTSKFDHEERLIRFYDSLKIGDKFIAKVSHVFKRSAEVLLVWSPKRDLQDLKIKANLRLFQAKQSWSHHYKIDEKEWNLDVSELIFVEVIHFHRLGDSKSIEVLRSRSKNDEEPYEEIDEDSIRTGKYRTINSCQMSFHEYMMDHNDLRNPSLIKLPPFTSFVNSDHVIKCLEHHRTKKNFEENKKLGFDKINFGPSDSGGSSSIRKTHKDIEHRKVLESGTSSERIKISSSYDNLFVSKRTKEKNDWKHKSNERHKRKSKKKHSKSNHKKHKRSHYSSSEDSSQANYSSSSSDHRHSKKRSKKKKNDKINNKILQLLKFT